MGEEGERYIGHAHHVEVFPMSNRWPVCGGQGVVVVV